MSSDYYDYLKDDDKWFIKDDSEVIRVSRESLDDIAKYYMVYGELPGIRGHHSEK